MKFFTSIIVLLMLGSCAKKEIASAPSVSGLEYYPLSTGRYSVFECDSLVFVEIPRDTVRYRYQVKEVLSSPFTDDAGREAWRLERYIRWFDAQKPFDSLPWIVKDVWQVSADMKSVQVTEENVRYTKLSFPVREGAVWNGNAFNNLGDEQYVYEYAGRGETIALRHFGQTLRVIQREDRTLIAYEHGSEKYAAGVGLVYRSFTEIYSNNIVPGTAVEDRIEKGVIFTQTLIGHGHE